MQALKNLFENYMISAPEDEGLFTMFAHDVDRFSLWHLRILSLLGDPRKWAETKGVNLPEWSFGSAANLLEYSYTEMEGARDFYDPIVRDLFLAGLLSTDNLHRTVPFIQLFDPLTTPMGNLFIRLTRLSEAI
ncbi:MAG: hypothetical protein QHG99_09225 [Methanomicrobiales archaeon]|nr:hypothetical protein [Methanomicrobiales archaeon]